MKIYQFNVEGMMCEHCSARLQKVLEALEGVKNVQVILEEKKAVLEAEDNMEKIIKEAIEDSGFEVK